VRASSGRNTEFRFVRDGKFSAFSWVDGGLGFALVADVERPELLMLADAAFRQLDPGPLPASAP
jgi:anti-sigma factor RsiW